MDFNFTNHPTSASLSNETSRYINPYADQVGINTFIQIWTVAIALVGTIGNIMVIAAVALHNNLRNIGNLFIVNLAVADLGVSIVVNLASVAGSITSEEGIFIKYEWLCEIIAVVCIVTCSCSLWSIAAIAFNRYVWICHWQRYRKIFNRRTVPMMIACLWTIGFLIDLPNILGWGTHTFDWKVMSCTGGMSFVYSYAIFFAMTAFAAPLMIITFSYIGIFRFARKATLALDRVRNKNGVQNKNDKAKSGRAARPADLRLARSVLAIVIIYLLMWSPYSLTVLIDHRVVYDRKLYILSYTLAHTNSSFNCVIYGATNQQFRRGYMHFIRLLFCRAKKVDLLASVTGTMGTATLQRNNRVHPAEQTSPATQESAVH